MPTDLVLQRQTPKAPGYPVLGTLTGPGWAYCTLEDPYIFDSHFSMPLSSMPWASWPYTGLKLPGVTAIPEGRYRIYNCYSPRFERVLPLFVDVPQYTGVRIHPLNVAEQTEGCVGLGMRQDANRRTLLESAVACEQFTAWLGAQTTEVWVDVRNPK